MKILGVRIDNLTEKEIFCKIKNFLEEEKFHQIATINPEFVLQAQRNQQFRDILNKCNLNVADGIGIWWAFLRYGKFLRHRLAGSDLIYDILKMAEGKNLKVFLAINKYGLSNFSEIKHSLLERSFKLCIEGLDVDPGSFNDFPQINDDSILLCNFGAPSQEIFINSQKNAKIRLAMGVGGAFDFMTGKIIRAPLFVRKIGLEWFWRLLFQPQGKLIRLKRILNAIIIFPVKILLNQKNI